MDPETMDAMLTSHLERHRISQGAAKPWKVGLSPLGGRGLFAVRDIVAGELVCLDEALVVGPRARDKYLPVCARCYRSECALFPCDEGCGLPLCSTRCQESVEHRCDCQLLRSWEPRSPSEWHTDFLRVLVPLRALSLTEEELDMVRAFHYREEPGRECEVDSLGKHLRGKLEPEAEQLTRRICSVLDTNSFETVSVADGTTTSLRGLYPMVALLNHSCLPNTRHWYDADRRLHVAASMPIARGEEITMTYTDLFWDTMLRRRHMAGTKNFLCRCQRCSDPTENGSFIGGLKCADSDCDGLLLPVDPLCSTAPWRCNKCELTMKNRQILSIRAGLGSIVEELLCESPAVLTRFIDRELWTLVPPTNYIAVDMKLRIVSFLGRIENFYWNDLSLAQLRRKATYCRDLLGLMDTLGCGDCRMKGLIAWELYRTREVTVSRFALEKSSLSGSEEDDELFTIAKSILEGDVTAPRDFVEASDARREKNDRDPGNNSRSSF